MTDFKDMMAKKVQAAARGYIARKTGMGGKKRPSKPAGGKPKPGAKKPKKKDENVQAMVIQAAFRKYQEYQKKH